jgi:hypothetical protein
MLQLPPYFEWRRVCLVGVLNLGRFGEWGHARLEEKMSGDVASMAVELTPYVSAAVGAYGGGAVLVRVRDEAADATVSLGRRLLQRVFGFRSAAELLPDPLAALAANPADEDALAAVRLAIRQALSQDDALQAEVRTMLASAPGVAQQVRAGRDAYAAGRDQAVHVDNRRAAIKRPRHDDA